MLVEGLFCQRITTVFVWNARRLGCLTYSSSTLKVVQGSNLEDLLASLLQLEQTYSRP